MVIDNASILARYFDLSDLMVGPTVQAIDTILPELAMLVAGALNGANNTALGNVISSNIFNSVLCWAVPRCSLLNCSIPTPLLAIIKSCRRQVLSSPPCACANGAG